MAYQALYRKYRSQRFEEMVGQEVVATTLKNAIVNHQISHAYLFNGPRGTGKTSAAKIFAKAINCPNQKAGEPCNNCDICAAITRGMLEDVIELDAASNNGVDEIREIRDKSTYAASVAKYKVYIIDEVHMLSTGAFNALLKTLEEPVPGVVFILATTELQKIPATIISRVQRFSFKAITAIDIHEHLTEVLTDEQLDFEPEALEVIARSAEGGMRDALSLLDQAISFSADKLTLDDALLVTGTISDEILTNYIRALAISDVKSALQELEKAFVDGKNMLRFTEDLLRHFRDMLFAEEVEVSHDRLYLWIDIAIDSLKMLKETSQTKIAADVMTMRLADTKVKQKVEVDTSLATGEQQENLVVRASVAIPATKEEDEHAFAAPQEPAMPLSNLKSKREVNRSQVLKALDHAVSEKHLIGQVRGIWNEVTSALANPRDMALVKASRLAAVSSHYLILTVEQENLAQLIATNQAISDSINKSLVELCSINPEIMTLTESEWQDIRAEYAEAHKSAATPTEKESKEPETTSKGIELAQQLFGEKVIEIND